MSRLDFFSPYFESDASIRFLKSCDDVVFATRLHQLHKNTLEIRILSAVISSYQLLLSYLCFHKVISVLRILDNNSFSAGTNLDYSQASFLLRLSAV